MADGHRKYPVDYLILHHSTGGEFVNYDDKSVIDWYDAVGKSRGYSNGAVDSRHYHPITGAKCYSMAHFALRAYTKDGNKYGWRLTALIKDVWNNVCWHAGNWPMNQRSIGIEVCGNYLGKTLPDKACMLIADTFRQHDKEIGGKFQVRGHKQVSDKATACPGRIMENRATIIDMMNNPTTWNNKLWPVKEEPKEEDWTKEAKPIKEGAVGVNMVSEKDYKLYDFGTGEAIKDFSKDTHVTVHYKYGDYYITAWSYTKKIKNGFKKADLTEFVEDKTETEISNPVEEVEETTGNPGDSENTSNPGENTDQTDEKLENIEKNTNLILEIVNWIKDFIKNLFNQK